MNSYNLDFILNKFDRIDQSEIGNTIINNIKKKNKRVSDYFPDTESNSDYRAVKAMQKDPRFYRVNNTLYDFIKKFLSSENYSGLITEEDIQNSIKDEVVDPNAKDFNDFEAFWTELNNDRSGLEACVSTSADMKRSIIDRCKEAGEFITDQMGKYWIRDAKRDHHRRVTIDIDTNYQPALKNSSEIGDFVEIISKQMLIGKIGFKDAKDLIIQKSKAAKIFKKLVKDKVNISIKKKVEDYSFSHKFEGNPSYLDYQITVHSDYLIYFGDNIIQKRKLRKLITYEEAKKEFLDKLYNDVTGKLLFQEKFPNK